ncbi:MAG: AAA family ATPase, partial [Verrucomicrobia bacterium]|nr:AAA family ATPase [Verrucomicrobiota bacterium]
MRILRIQFENLNSLRSGEINLEHGPLAEAGIFAITGPTGAGKSTLLDALTLALYGRAARYDKEPNPEHMMSRHTGSCRAEVLFEVPRGRFQARWELRRARGKAEGKLQPAKRTVVEDGSGTVLAEKMEDADRLIEELTGLDYERFRRSVLLAQGEFTRFLKAKPDERAELLESLTGTAIYSQLSELAYREATRREEELGMRREALGRMVLLTPEERASKASEIERLTLEIDGLAQRRAATAQQIEHGRQLLARLGEAAELARKESALCEEFAQAAPQLEQGKAHRLAQPFLASLQTWEALEKQSTAEAARAREAQKAVAEARLGLASGLRGARALAEVFLQEAQRGLEQSDAVLHVLGEQWVQAETGERNAAAQALRAGETLAKLLAGRTVEEVAAESRKLDQKRNLLGELRTAMEKRDNAAAEAARLSDEEAHLVEEVEAASHEKAATLAEMQAQGEVLESAQAYLEQQERIAGLDDQR